MTPHFHPLTVADVRRETSDAVSLRFDIPAELSDAYRFAPGQHLTLKTRIGDEELRRSYSICSGVHDGEIRVAIKKVPGGKFSTWANEALKPGMVLDVMAPDGRFTVQHKELSEKREPRHYVAFAAGSGITPILSIIRSTLADEPESRFTLVYGNRRQSQAMFLEALEDLKNRHLQRFQFFPLFSREEQEIDLFNGRIDGAKVARFLDTLIPVASIDDAFICGPNEMIDEVEAALKQAGLAASHIHTERFGVPGSSTPRQVEPGDATHAAVTIHIDGLKRELEFHEDSPSILDVGLAAGLNLPYSCKGGVCCTCRAKVLEGQVRMEKNYTLEQPDVDAGYVLTCQCYPLTERVVISFDDR